MARHANTVNWAGLLLAALIFIGIGIAVLIGVDRFIADARYVSHTNAVIATVDGFEARLRDAESAQRGFLITGNAELLAIYHLNREQWVPLLERARQLVVDNPSQLERVQQLQALGQQRMQQINDNLAQYRRGGLAAARSGIDAQTLTVSAQMRQLVRQIVQHEEMLLAQRSISSQDSAMRLRVLALLGIPLGIVVLGTVYWRLLQEVRRRARAELRSQDTTARLTASLARLEQHSTDLTDLGRYAGLLQNAATVEEAVTLCTDLLARWLPDSAGTLYRIRASRDYAERLTGWAGSDQPELVAPQDCWALRRGQLHVCEPHRDAARCAHVGPAGTVATRSVCLPMIAQGVPLGFVHLALPAGADTGRLELVQSAVEQLAMTLHTLSLQEKLRVQSIRDPLTGLFNRRYLEEALDHELARSQRRGQPFSVLMLDVDHFKTFNDQHGHPGGDALLAALGQLLRSRARAEDIACRYGGEEFTLILPETDAYGALCLAETLRQAVQAMRVDHMGRELPPVTVSIGLATHLDSLESSEQLIQRADRALYRAKREGRDRVVADNGTGWMDDAAQDTAAG